MVVSRNDIKRKRKDSDTTLETLPDSPKRTKVHAQRKFAQGSNISSPVITPVKEIEKEKIKCNDVLLNSTSVELLPIKRPHTEDFLTFLCFRGTPILPPNLHFFSNANSIDTQTVSTKSDSSKTSPTTNTINTSLDENSDKPFIAFGVRKRADPFVSNKLEKKRRHALALQTLRRKYQEQRMAKIRAVTIEKLSQGIKIKSKNLVQTRSVTKRETDALHKRKIKVVTKRVQITRTTVKRPLLKQKMCLRSRGRFIPRELTQAVKKRPMKPIIKVKPQKSAESSDFSSDDDQPLKVLRKTVQPKLKAVPIKVVKSIAASPKKSLIRITRNTNPKMRMEPRISPRPTRKTKEAAAVYMEILGRKLVLDAEVDDDNLSIDSFPELPNVRRTEKQENELKAQAKINVHNSTVNIRRNTTRIKQIFKPESSKANLITKPKEECTKVENSDESDKSNSEQPENIIKKVLRSNIDKIAPKEKVPQTKEKCTGLKEKDNKSSKTNEEKTIPCTEKTTSKDKSIKSTSKTVTKEKLPSSKDKPSIPKLKPPVLKDKDKVKKDIISKLKSENFSDSDEEPLAKLTSQTKVQKSKSISSTTNNQSTLEDVNKTIDTDKSETNVPCKSKNEVPTSVPFLSLSDDDEEKAFRGFVKSDDKTLSHLMSQDTKCLHTNVPTTSADLLCKDIGLRFGKGKVNMSTEQIEKWLKDSALAGECSKKDPFEKKYEDEIKYEEKICKTDVAPPEIPIKTEEVKVDVIDKKVVQVHKLEEKKTPCVTKAQTSIERKHIFNQRRSILSKNNKDAAPNTKAFSPDNESSVYAFQADTESPINTPFRSHNRRPSSTATSRSEDEVSKTEDEEKKKSAGKFRMPALFKPSAKNQGKQEVSLTLSTDDLNSSTSIAVQVNLDSDTGDNNVSMECSTQTDTGDEDGDGHLFYIPLQPRKQSTSNQQIIQGVAVKLGTEGSNGPNQRVVMRAKLVTHSSDGLPMLGQQKPLAKGTAMYPPVGTVQPTYRPKQTNETNIKHTKSTDTKQDSSTQSTDIKTVPSSPSASSSSSIKITKRATNPRARSLDFCIPINSTEFPKNKEPAKMVEAPTFHPTEKEFQDPMEFIEKIRRHAEKFGICRIVPPPNFKPECKVSDDMRFTAYNQYVHKMLHRWGPNFKELMAIRKYLATQSITLTHPPWIGGMEIDLPRLYQTVQSLGGLKEVIEKKRWPKVAEGMKIPKSAQDRVTKLDDIYCKYLLPYDTLSPAEREKLFDEVETEWAKRESKRLSQSQQAQANVSQSGSSNESDSDSGDDELDECIIKGRSMALNAFYRIARNTMSMWFRTTEPTAQEVEQEFWKHVMTRQNHICVHSGSIDSSGWGYGFACSKNSPFARHPWNLKVFTNNSGSVLRSLGPVMGVTVPTLHVGMVFSACCWYRDPHALPWIEYLHTGANKIWYGIPDSLSSVFHSTLTQFVPNYCHDKTLWLPSDTAMVPPSLLVQNGVSVCRTVQEPGQFIVVFPKAFTSSVCSGYVVSESVYFATPSWLQSAQSVFKDIRESKEPSMFSLEKLTLNIASDTRSNSEVLRHILPSMTLLKDREKSGRNELETLGLKTIERLPIPESNNPRRKRKLLEDEGEYECEVCRINLYVSFVIDSQEEGVYCLDHAIEHLKSKTNNIKHCKLLYTYDIGELETLIEKIKTNIELKSLRKNPNKFGSAAAFFK